MQYTRLGSSGLEISRLCLGCMSFGDPAKGNHSWVLDEEQSRHIIRHALESGITFFDTANTYSLGESEAVLGRTLWSMARREDVVLATKVYGRMRPGPNGSGLSRKAILFEIDQSLSRLGTDYVDLYQIHRFDPDTPIEETLEALSDIVKAGKVRYIGASSMAAWQFMKMIATQERLGLARFCLDAEPPQPHSSPRRARDVAALHLRGDRCSALESAGPILLCLLVQRGLP